MRDRALLFIVFYMSVCSCVYLPACSAAEEVMLKAESDRYYKGE